ncbi:MAG: lauroyl acyltransferase, partial [Alphaproteobacteria bacterium]|nr:lauroyl acyltransferase [Alphaproteobacteria bacterium]
MRNVKYILQAALFAGLMLFFRALPLETASALGGWLGGRLGRHLKTLVHVARVNLALAFPQKSVEEREAILSAMWAHLGRLAGEFPHLPGNALLNRISYEGLHHLPPPGQVALFVSGHFGNWELTYPTAFEHGVP